MFSESLITEKFVEMGILSVFIHRAVKDVWKKPLMEVFNVDTNLNMNELAYKIMSSMKGQSSPATGMFFRQFLPVTPEVMRETHKSTLANKFQLHDTYKPVVCLIF